MKLRTDMMHLFKIVYTTTESLFDKGNQKIVNVVAYTADDAIETIRNDEEAYIVFCTVVCPINNICDGLIKELDSLLTMQRLGIKSIKSKIDDAETLEDLHNFWIRLTAKEKDYWVYAYERKYKMLEESEKNK